MNLIKYSYVIIINLEKVLFIQVDKKGCVLTTILLRYNACSVLNKNLSEFGPLMILRKKDRSLRPLCISLSCNMKLNFAATSLSLFTYWVLENKWSETRRSQAKPWILGKLGPPAVAVQFSWLYLFTIELMAQKIFFLE